MKDSNGFSASKKGALPAPPLPGKNQASNSRIPSPPSRAADSQTPGFALAGRSDLPDPATHAYRQDLADVALAGRVIASHYAEPLVRRVGEATPFLAKPGGEVVQLLAAGDTIEILDCSLGWAWGYAGPDRRVGYVSADALRP